MLHDVDQTGAEDLIKAHNGLKANGVYLVRKGADELQLILSVSFKGKFVHNALTRTDAGSAFQLNGKDTKLVDLDEVLKLLAKKSKALMWPVALTTLVPVQRAQGDGGGITSLPFYHGELAAGDAADICAGKNGNFLLRHDPSHPPLDYALAVVFKNKVSHHKVHVPASGNIVLNGKDTQLTDISALLTLLKKKQKKLMWPAPLVAPVVCVGVLPGDANVADTMERVKALHVSAPPPGPSAPSQAAPEPAAQDFDVLDTEATPDAYHDVDIEGGKKLLLANLGVNVNGKYLLRPGTAAGSLVLSVIFKGQVTHHTINKTAADGSWLLNNIQTDAATLPDLLGLLTKKSKTLNWPLRLTEPVHHDVPGDLLVSVVEEDEGPPEPSRPVTAVAYNDYEAPSLTDTELHRLQVFVSTSMSPFYHAEMGTDAATALLMSDRVEGVVAGKEAATAADSDAFEGVFLVRDDDQEPSTFANGSQKQYIISVVRARAVVHERITRSTLGQLMLHNHGTGCGDLNTLIKYMEGRQPSWSAPLTKGVLGTPVLTDTQQETKVQIARDIEQRAAEAKEQAVVQSRLKHRQKSIVNMNKIKKQAQAGHVAMQQREAELNRQTLARQRSAAQRLVDNERRAKRALEEASKQIEQKYKNMERIVQKHAHNVGDESSDSDSDSDGESWHINPEDQAEANRARQVRRNSKLQGSAGGLGEVAAPAPVADDNIGNVQTLVYDAMPNEAAYAMLLDAPQTNGKWLLRRKVGARRSSRRGSSGEGGSEWVLNVLVEQDIKSFEITKNPDGLYLVDINNSMQSSLFDLVKFLSAPRMELPPWFEWPLTSRAALIKDKHRIKDLFREHKEQLKILREAQF